ncbi:acyl-CoA dehydrogenase family protein [Nocardioides sp. Root151]|uniref:acyl-CoA dehydrogenase family protein n=1 Tax=Nocardioides sp. Root151 TaxID=1736475 RepID=UPI0007027D53|nr:acyl-CoA dehydrogenase family protein [Nocardioides sp. Root151]KQZ68837.1 DNA alkylation response protein [Nocardioides sp. Root151]
MIKGNDVINQVPELIDYDVSADPALREGMVREGAEWALDDLTEVGRAAGSHEVQEWGRLANENEPILHRYDSVGHRIDEIEYHPAYHSLMSKACEFGLNAAPWFDDRPGTHAARTAKSFIWGQAESGHMCPIGMSYAAVPTLRHAPKLDQAYSTQLGTKHYDPKLRALDTKPGLVFGMSMTERQGGSDARANISTAAERPDGTFEVFGHKWFTSAPMCDAFLTLVQTESGLSCLFLPRVLPDDSRNPIRLERLKDKLGNRSNASAEIEYHGATGWLVGEEGRGVRAIMEMVNFTRLNCVAMSTAFMRKGLMRAVHHAQHRSAFGNRLIEQPLMRNVLADLTLESEAAVTALMRLGRATDRAETSESEANVRRLGLAVIKYWVCKRAQAVVGEALECLGGNGYIENSGMPRLYREAPLQSIWEGAGNVAALDVLRAIRRQPETVEAFLGELHLASGGDRRLDAAISDLERDLRVDGVDQADLEFGARRLVERLALVFQASLVVRHSTPAIADAFVASRLGGEWGIAFGTLPRGIDIAGILQRVPSGVTG